MASMPMQWRHAQLKAAPGHCFSFVDFGPEATGSTGALCRMLSIKSVPDAMGHREPTRLQWVD